MTDDRLAAGNKATLNAAATILKKLASSTELPNQYALYNLGCIEAKTGDTKQAIKHFSEAIKADKMFAEAYYNRGLLLLEQGEKDKARQDLSKAGELGLYKAYAILKGGFTTCFGFTKEHGRNPAKQFCQPTYITNKLYQHGKKEKAVTTTREHNYH